MVIEPGILEWLLDSDPALRWQVERDLAGAPAATWQVTRDRVATEGMGAALLSHQDPDGQWAGGAYFPSDFSPEEQREPGQPWTATTWTLNTLRDFGLDATVLAGTAAKLRANSHWEYDDLPYWDGEVDACINAFTLANGAWLGAWPDGDPPALPGWFREHQLPDGGWNCEWVEGSTRSSFHSTLNSLKGLLYYEQHTGDTQARQARITGQEYLLRRRVLYRLSTGELVGPWATRFGYPFRWVHTALNAADYFRAAARHDQQAPDPRLAEAIDLIRDRRRPDGTWLQEHRFPGRVWFQLDVPVGEPSKWLTFHALRVLAWWDEAHGPASITPSA